MLYYNLTGRKGNLEHSCKHVKSQQRLEGEIKSKYTTKLIVVVLEIFPTNLRQFKCII